MTPNEVSARPLTRKDLQREKYESVSRSAEPLGVFIYPQKKAVTKGGLMAEPELTGHRKQIFETQCRFCPDYQDRLWVARAINKLFRTRDDFTGETIGGDGEWSFDSCYASCTWNMLHENKRQNKKSNKYYHKYHPDFKPFPAEKTYKVRVK